MARRKRSEKVVKVGVAIAERPKAKRKVLVPLSPTSESLQAFCPVCGRTITDRAVKAGGVTVGKTPYFDTIDWDPDKSFGVALSAAGRGSFANWRYIGTDEAPELFEQVRTRMLQATREWLAKEWITRTDVEALLK